MWKEKNEFTDYNFFDSKTRKPEKITPNDFKDYLNKNCKNKKVVITAGHFIPNVQNYDDIPENPLKTWRLACKTAKYLKDNGIKAKISLILNDTYLRPEEREIIFTKYLGRLPKIFSSTMEDEKLTSRDILRCNFNGDFVFSEKKLSNRTTYLARRKQVLGTQFRENGHCIAGLISYFIDLYENQDIDVSIIMFPLCSWVSTKKAIDLYSKLNNKLRHTCYFHTPNCLY